MQSVRVLARTNCWLVQADSEALPAIVDAVGKDNIEIYLDSGVRSGQDVIRSVAMGARGVFIGRPFLYGLGAMGEAGVTKALEVIRNEADLTMAPRPYRKGRPMNTPRAPMATERITS